MFFDKVVCVLLLRILFYIIHSFLPNNELSSFVE